MKRSVLVVVLLLYTLICGVVYTNAAPTNTDCDAKLTSEECKQYFLLEPKLGRKKRNSNFEENQTVLDKEQLMALLELIRAAPWAMISLNDNKLGKMKNNEDANFDEEKWSDSEYNDISQRSPPFTPRLGRRSPFIPRLGRQSVRSPFIPRLGRDSDKMS